jgi:hypothetical protein
MTINPTGQVVWLLEYRCEVDSSMNYWDTGIHFVGSSPERCLQYIKDNTDQYAKETHEGPWWWAVYPECINLDWPKQPHPQEMLDAEGRLRLYLYDSVGRRVLYGQPPKEVAND